MLNQIPAVQAVTNPESTRGGADAETLELVPPIPVTAQGLVSSSGPAPSPPPARGKSNPISQFLAKHSAGTAFDRAAITPADYERIAFDSSAGILAVVCLRAGEVPDGLSSPGKILRLIVVALDDNPSADPASGLKLSTALENTAQKAIGKCAHGVGARPGRDDRTHPDSCRRHRHGRPHAPRSESGCAAGRAA